MLWCHYCISVPLSQPTMLRLSGACRQASTIGIPREQRARTGPRECCGDYNLRNRMGMTITHVNLETRKNMIAQQACGLVTEALLACFDISTTLPLRPACVPRKDRCGSAREGRLRGVPLAATTATRFLCAPPLPARFADGCETPPSSRLLTGSRLYNAPIFGGHGHRNDPHMDPHGPTRGSFVARKVRVPGARTIRCRARVIDRDGRGQRRKRSSTPARRGV